MASTHLRPENKCVSPLFDALIFSDSLIERNVTNGPKIKTGSGSPNFYNWLVSAWMVGDHTRNWRQKRCPEIFQMLYSFPYYCHFVLLFNIHFCWSGVGAGQGTGTGSILRSRPQLGPGPVPGSGSGPCKNLKKCKHSN